MNNAEARNRLTTTLEALRQGLDRDGADGAEARLYESGVRPIHEIETFLGLSDVGTVDRLLLVAGAWVADRRATAPVRFVAAITLAEDIEARIGFVLDPTPIVSTSTPSTPA